MNPLPRHARKRPSSGWPVILISALLVTLATPALAADDDSAVATAESTERVMRDVAADDVGYEALVNTLGLRSTAKKFAGKYVTNAEGRRAMKAGVANQLFTEMGVFRDVSNHFKLLGADGQWVKLKWDDGLDDYKAGTWAKEWSKAWSFKVKRPKQSNIKPNVESALLASEINPRHPVCVRAFAPNGNYKGLLGVTSAGKMVLKENAKCGNSTTTLFMTDTVPMGTAAGSVAKGVEIDKLTYTRFVAPDGPALTLKETRRELMRQDIEDYFDALRSFNNAVKSDVQSDVHNVTLQLLPTSYVIEDPAEEVNILDFIIDQTATLLAFIPKGGEIASAALQMIYDSAKLGVAIAHNQNLEGPRIVQGVNNAVLTTAAEIHTEYDNVFSKIGENIDAMKELALEGCPSRRTCTSDRKLAAWWDADPNADLPAKFELARQQTVATHELVIWERLLPIRGKLYQPAAWFNMVGKRNETNCSPGYPWNSPVKNEELMVWYQSWAEDGLADEATWGRPLLMSHVYAPYQNWYKPFWCAGAKVHRAYMSAWTIGLANDDAAAVTPVAGMSRLFDAWDPANPVTSGFGLSKQEVACQWLNNPASGYMGSADYYFNPCHFAFYDEAGAVENPYSAEENTKYAAALPWSATYWVPNETELGAGRLVSDFDVVSPLVQKLDFESCSADIVSVDGGSRATVRFTNLYDGEVEIYWVNQDGSLSAHPVATLARQDTLSRPLGGQNASGPAAFGQLMKYLEYSNPIQTTVGKAFQVTNGAGECLGQWVVPEPQSNAAVPYAVAEIHGDDGILNE